MRRGNWRRLGVPAALFLRRRNISYLDIQNLYKDQDILLFKQCFAMEKVHGTSAHVGFKNGIINLFPGGEKLVNFECLFNKEQLLANFKALIMEGAPCVVFGEAYGGKCQGMKDTYGSSLAFVAFEVKIGDCWLAVPRAEDLAVKLGFEFMPYTKISTDLACIDAERDKPSEVAVRRGMGANKKREGVVLRPLIEVMRNNGSRVIAKHKQDWARETHTPRIVDPAKQAVLNKAQDIANEWVMPMRLEHVLQDLAAKGTPATGVEHTRNIIMAMVEDVYKESKGEIIESEEVRRAIGAKTAFLWKTWLQNKLKETHEGA